VSSKIIRDREGRCICPRPLPDRLAPCEVADYLGVTARTVATWAREGKLKAVYTLGGHRRFEREEVEALEKAIARKKAFR
jgi:excisionase family DNA binding protein